MLLHTLGDGLRASCRHGLSFPWRLRQGLQCPSCFASQLKAFITGYLLNLILSVQDTELGITRPQELDHLVG